MRDILFLLFVIMTVFTCAFMAVASLCSVMFSIQISEAQGYHCVLMALLIWTAGILSISLPVVIHYMNYKNFSR